MCVKKNDTMEIEKKANKKIDIDRMSKCNEN